MAGISADQEAKIKALLDKAAGGRLVQSMTELHEYLMGQKLAWKQRLQCSLVGVHTANRDGLGVSAAHVHELIGSIAAIGYSCEESRQFAWKSRVGLLAMKSASSTTNWSRTRKANWRQWSPELFAMQV